VTPLVSAEHLTYRLPTGGAIRPDRPLVVVNDVSLSIERGETVGLVGESGSGKSTLARLLLGLFPPSNGRIFFDGIDLASAPAAARRHLRRRMQMVFHDARSSLDPRRTIGAQIADGLAIHRIVPEAQQRARVGELLDAVSLPPAFADQHPHQLSSGQRQRVGIARALATEPEFLIADEPVSMLDVSEQAQILELLAELRARLGLTLLFISSDLAAVRSLCQRAVVMYLGRIMEDRPMSRVVAAPRHPYTQALLSAAPSLDPTRRGTRILLQGDPPSLSDAPTGCVFRTRCPFALPECAKAAPALVGGAACIRADQAA
jgi:oligopeptide/dipeptide ABC transporter ATP-binding protein